MPLLAAPLAALMVAALVAGIRPARAASVEATALVKLRTVTVEGDRGVITLRIADPQGRPVPISTVTRITLKSSEGGRYTFSPARPPTLTADRLVRRQAGLVTVPIRYTVTEVVIGGANVVFAGSQRFVARPSAAWTVDALLFPLRLQVRDAFFRWPVGSSVRLTLPDGSSRMIDLEDDHSVTIAQLPRGTYEVKAEGWGFGLSSPVALSQPQTARVLLLSWIDVAAVTVVALLFLVGLPLLGGRLIWARRTLPRWRSTVDDGPGTMAERGRR